MGIIGYDGRLSPAGRALNVSAPNGFDVGAVEKIGNAQPKFVEGVMKLYDVVGDGMTRYGDALARKEKRMEELSDQESVMTKREELEASKRKIEEDETITPEQKIEKAGSLSVSFDDTGDEERNRKLALEGRRMTFNAVNGIYSQAKAQEQRAKDASFGAFTITEEATIVQLFNSSLPELLSGVSGIDDVVVVVDKFVEDNLGGKESEVSQEKRPAYDRFKAGLKARLITALGGAYTKRQESEIDNNVNTIIAGVSAGAADIFDVWSAVEDVLDAPEAEGYYTNTKRREKITSAMISYTENGIGRAKEELSTNVDVAKKSLSQYLVADDKASFNEGVAGMNAAIEDVHDNLLEKVENERKAVISSIEEDKSLSDEQRGALIMFVNNKYDGFVRDVNKSKANTLTSFRKDAELTKKKVGEDNFGTLQKLFRGQEVEIPAGAMTAFNLMNPDEQFITEFNRNNKPVDGVLSAYLAQNYSGMSEVLARKASVLDFQHAIADVDMSRKGEQNLFIIESILSNAATLYGLNSSEYEQVASFARENMVHERNDKKSDTDAFLEEYVYHGDKKDWEKAASYEQRLERNRIEKILSEVAPEKWQSMADRLKEQIETNDRFSIAMTAGEIPGRVKAAKIGAHSTPTKAKVGVAENTEFKGAVAEKVSSLDKDAAIAQKKAELSALESGSLLYTATEAGENAGIDYWKKVAKKEKIPLDTEFDSVESIRYQVLNHLEFREKLNARATEEFEKRKKLEAEMVSLGLPLDPSEYSSFLGIGGLPLNRIKGFEDNKFDELEAGITVGQKQLTSRQMESILEQYKEYKKPRQGRDLSAERVRKLKAEIAEVEGGKK